MCRRKELKLAGGHPVAEGSTEKIYSRKASIRTQIVSLIFFPLFK